AHSRLRAASAATSGTPTSYRALSVVPRSAQVRHSAACRVRHGHREGRRLGLQAGSPPGNDRLSSHALQDLSLMAPEDRRLNARASRFLLLLAAAVGVREFRLLLLQRAHHRTL